MGSIFKSDAEVGTAEKGRMEVGKIQELGG